MKIIEYHLPSFCYSRQKRIAEGLCLHYFSAINADPTNWDNPKRCYELFFDLNLSMDSRQHGPWMASLGVDRNYASADFMIDRKGKVYELVPEPYKSYHAGKSMFRGRPNVNEFMAGVELFGAPQVSSEYDFTELQYRALADLIIEKDFPVDMITTHSRIRDEYLSTHIDDKITVKKHDPGKTFAWDKLNKLLGWDIPHSLNGD